MKLAVIVTSVLMAAGAGLATAQAPDPKVPPPPPPIQLMLKDGSVLTGWVLGQLPDGDEEVARAERTAIDLAVRGLTT